MDTWTLAGLRLKYAEQLTRRLNCDEMST